ncbi:MAG: CoB--CoM heterodisulfide reductase iron-sulfur subunit B family protein [Deltaproteobacteria bacterium]|nr:CoB--CoM heterodisulfide reductase iron-sulfur subunit B family protein [Deltaproteobacteria bacterium]
MNLAFFPGCKITHFAPQYEAATRAVLAELGVEFAEIEFNCCGYPVRHQHFFSFLLSAARNLALAEREGLGLFTPCQCCFGSLKKAGYLLAEDGNLRSEVNQALAEEGLAVRGPVEVKHLLTLLRDDVGLEALKEKAVRPFNDLKIAAHYGCHALRPSKVVGFDDPLKPTILESLIAATGAEAVDWPERLDCCGNPLSGKNDDLALDLTRKKLAGARAAGADCLCVACTYCHLQFDQVQSSMLDRLGEDGGLPAILYPQLLGLSMGLTAESLGLGANRLDLSKVINFLA